MRIGGCAARLASRRALGCQRSYSVAALLWQEIQKLADKKARRRGHVHVGGKQLSVSRSPNEGRDRRKLGVIIATFTARILLLQLICPIEAFFGEYRIPDDISRCFRNFGGQVSR